jgi:hypothetical protein
MAASGILFNPFSIDWAGWDPILMTSDPVFPNIDDQFANVGNAFVFPPGNLLGDEPTFASLSASHASHAAAPIASAAPPTTAPTLPRQPAQHRFPCTQAPCVKSFVRDADRRRHEKSTHFAQYGAHCCPVAGCPKSYGAGFCRPDKVKEHLRNQHGAQGKA